MRVAEPAEALEIHPSEQARAVLGDELGVDWLNDPGFVQTEYDPIMLGICGRWRMAACVAAPLTGLEADELVHNLLVHVAVRYFAARAPKRVRGDSMRADSLA